MSKEPLNFSSLTNFTAEEKELLQRLVRPVGSAPDPDFESAQFLGFLQQLNGVYEEVRKSDDDKVPSLRSVHRAGLVSTPPQSKTFKAAI